MDWNAVTTFSHNSDTIFWYYSLVHISRYKFIVMNFHEFCLHNEWNIQWIGPIFPSSVQTFSHSFTSCNVNLVCGAYTYSSIWADALETVDVLGLAPHYSPQSVFHTPFLAESSNSRTHHAMFFACLDNITIINSASIEGSLHKALPLHFSHQISQQSVAAIPSLVVHFPSSW